MEQYNNPHFQGFPGTSLDNPFFIYDDDLVQMNIKGSTINNPISIYGSDDAKTVIQSEYSEKSF